MTHKVLPDPPLKKRTCLVAFACECIRSGITNVLELEGYLNANLPGQ